LILVPFAGMVLVVVLIIKMLFRKRRKK